jgi:hypothetical protein
MTRDASFSEIALNGYVTLAKRFNPDDASRCVTGGLTRPSRPCSTPGCRRLAVARGRCGPHAAERQRDRPNARERGYSPRWDAYARAWLQRLPWCGQQHDGRFDPTYSRCARAGKRTQATVVNHRHSPHQGGDWFDPLNLESMCKACNLAHAHATGLMKTKTTVRCTGEQDWNIG